MMMDATGSTTSIVMTASVAVAAMAVVGLTLAQSDAVSRHVLTPIQLAAKRLSSYYYAWNQALLEQTKIFYQFETSVSSHTASSTQSPIDELCSSFDEINSLISSHILSKTSSAKRFRVVRIGRDERSDTASSSSSSSSSINSPYFVWLLYETDHDRSEHLVQLPLIPFGLALAKALEEQYISTVTLCFVFDAAGGVASSCVHGLLTHLSKVEPTNENVALAALAIRHPAWMIQWALLYRTLQLQAPHERSWPVEDFCRCLYAFCRLETVSAAATSTTVNTVVLTIPTAVVPVLLPILHDLFPDDRHVFAYTGCVSAVTAGTAATATTAAKSGSSLSSQSFASPVATTTPIGNDMATALGLPFINALTQLPVSMAARTECWIAAVDAVLKSKGLRSTVANGDNAYLPYMCKLDYVFPLSTVASVSSTTTSTTTRPSSSHWATRSLIQYVTGSASREVPVAVMEAATLWLHDFDQVRRHQSQPISLTTKRHIENVVFAHKSILIANKTLPDTVAPEEHWALKQRATKRGGCACCMPEDDDEDEENGDNVLAKSQDAMPGTGLRQRRNDTSELDVAESARSRGRRGFVDGTLEFAFDPTKFT